MSQNWGAGIGTVLGGIGGFALGGPAGAMAGAGLGAQVGGGMDANDTNMQLAANANAANAANAKDQMQFQEMMSSTAHQREVADLEKAGINPLLSANGGASTPTGAMATNVAPQVQNPFGGMASTAMNVASGLQGMEAKDAEIGYTKAMTEKAKMDTQVASRGIPEADMKNSIYSTVKPYIQSLWNRMTTTAKDAMSTKRAYDNAVRQQQLWEKAHPSPQPQNPFLPLP